MSIKSDGTKYEVNKSIVEIRPAYIKKFFDYKLKNTLSAEQAKDASRKRSRRNLKISSLKHSQSLQRSKYNKASLHHG